MLSNFSLSLRLQTAVGVTFLSLNKKVTKEVSIGEALTAKSIATSPVNRLSYPVFEPPSPMYPTRLALTMARSTLTYILSTTKMFRFLPCRERTEVIRQGGESGAAAVVILLRGFRHVDETLSSCQVRREGFTGEGVYGCGSTRQNASPVPTSLVTFLFGNKKVTLGYSPININLKGGIFHPQFYKKHGSVRIVCILDGHLRLDQCAGF